jgi:plasmid stabilization system protein ParE
VSKPPFRDEYVEAAIEDLIETQGSYDALRFGLGSEFSSAVTDRVDVLLEFPESGPVFGDGGLRRVAVGRFPYQIIYRFSGETVLVIAVVHERRHPRVWLGRLDSLG